MIILDTNVLSEPLRPEPHPAVADWLNQQVLETLFLTTITVAELRFDIAALPQGRRRSTLADRFEQEVMPMFAGRLLSFDEPSTVHYARLRAYARARGHAIATTDGYIAAIAATHDFGVATRDVAPFAAAGLQVINPFDRTGRPQ
ncbi:type II toxin-antitoxin system VapC family toxin [Microlunatus speluncae]|uniref:type II toxin-antitoxin system VapC family toxin n=1 Tax=Microlunatus speluncae TaxID=2594267 RepID=UPI0012661AB1|nr:type II toxin-antitoxin system VapC family toxin [Microlunatus speluncae]